MSNIFGSPRRFREDDWWQKRDPDHLLDDLKGRAEKIFDEESDRKHASYSSTSSKKESTTRTSEFSSHQKSNGTDLKDKETEEKEFFEEENQFLVKVDIGKFPVETVRVKVLANNTLLIDAEHEEKSGDHNVMKRSLSRKFVLPTEVDTEKVTSQVNENRLLTICAPKKGAGNQGERIIPVKLV